MLINTKLCSFISFDSADSIDEAFEIFKTFNNYDALKMYTISHDFSELQYVIHEIL